jgi:NadR type nicotinamide-nucleotide adenylyltransferase
MLKKIVILGPESTGKSNLCRQLAEHYHTSWVPEYAREFLEKHGPGYSYEDLLTIAKGQLELENRIPYPASRIPYPVFLDTNLYVIKIWSEVVFQKCHRFVLDAIAERKYDLYLLKKPDLDWTPDPLREYPDLSSREKHYKMYKDCLVNQPAPWKEIGGSDTARLKAAIQAVDASGFN